MRTVVAPENGCELTPQWRWRGTLVQDLDFFPQYDPDLVRTRCLQKLGVLRWPAATLLAGTTPVVVIGAAPNEDGGVDLWSVFSPLAQISRKIVARKLARELPRLIKAAGGREVRICVDHRVARADRFARFLGFRPRGVFERDPISGVKMEVWSCRA